MIAVAGFRVANGLRRALPYSGPVNNGAWRPSPMQPGAHPCQHRRLRRNSPALWRTHLHRGTRMGLSTLSTLHITRWGAKPLRHGVPTGVDEHCAQGRFPNERTGLNLGLSGPSHMVSLMPFSGAMHKERAHGIAITFAHPPRTRALVRCSGH